LHAFHGVSLLDLWIGAVYMVYSPLFMMELPAWLQHDSVYHVRSFRLYGPYSCHWIGRTSGTL